MIEISLDTSALEQATSLVGAVFERQVRGGFELMLESIAARAKQTTSFTDRTGALRNSIQSDGVTGTIESGLVGTISFAASSGAGVRRSRKSGRRRKTRGAYYGVFLEFGTRYISERRFIRDAIDAEDGQVLEDAIESAFRISGFEVG